MVYATEHGGSGTGLEGRGLPSLTELNEVGRRGRARVDSWD